MMSIAAKTSAREIKNRIRELKSIADPINGQLENVYELIVDIEELLEGEIPENTQLEFNFKEEKY